MQHHTTFYGAMFGVLLPKINDYSQLFNIGGGADVNYFLFLGFRGKNCHEIHLPIY